MYLARIECAGSCSPWLPEAMTTATEQLTFAVTLLTVLGVVAVRVWTMRGFGGGSKECETEG